MERVKYVIIKGMPVMFHPGISHDAISAQIHYSRGKVESAGFVNVGDDGRFSCYGESISLGIKSRPELDTKLINRMFHPYD